MMNEQCFALIHNNKGKLACKATVNSCNGHDETCPFYKTLADLIAGREESNKRIAKLSEYKQQQISEKYYKGEKPWRIYAEEYAGTGGEEAIGEERQDLRMAGYAEENAYVPGV